MLGQTILWDEVNRRRPPVISVGRGTRTLKIHCVMEGTGHECTDANATGSTCSHDYRFLIENGFTPLVSIARDSSSHL